MIANRKKQQKATEFEITEIEFIICIKEMVNRVVKGKMCFVRSVFWKVCANNFAED